MRKSSTFALALFLAACGGGSDSSNSDAGGGGGSGDGGGSDSGSTSSDGSMSDGSSASDASMSMDAGAGSDASTSDGGSGACPAAPAGIDATTMAAYTKVMATRNAMGLPCATMVATINTGATNHCGYYAANTSSAGSCKSTTNPHAEVSGCSMFTGASFSTRMTYAGYTGTPVFECMAFSNNGTSSVQQWIDSVWHRTPVLSPWTRDFGYGHATGCDTMDFGAGAATPNTAVFTYPYAGQTGVPKSFNGLYEGPPPPAPPTGWPSGYPITIYLNGTVTTHTLRVDGTTTDIAHQWLDPATQSLLDRDFVMYANAPLAAATTYRVHVEGSNAGGPVTIDFTFTTQ